MKVWSRSGVSCLEEHAGDSFSEIVCEIISRSNVNEETSRKSADPIHIHSIQVNAGRRFVPSQPGQKLLVLLDGNKFSVALYPHFSLHGTLLCDHKASRVVLDENFRFFSVFRNLRCTRKRLNG